MNLKEKFAFYCGPTLMGIKPASLFSLKNVYISNNKNEIALIYEQIHKKGLDIIEIRRCNDSTLIFIFNESQIYSLINDKILLRLYMLGYPKSKDPRKYLYYMLWKLKYDKKEFPHEIGYFLGFPYKDADAFIENKGKNCKLCGCWKSYVDCDNANLVFQKYNMLKNCCLDRVRQGAEIDELIVSVGG